MKKVLLVAMLVGVAAQVDAVAPNIGALPPARYAKLMDLKDTAAAAKTPAAMEAALQKFVNSNDVNLMDYPYLDGKVIKPAINMLGKDRVYAVLYPGMSPVPPYDPVQDAALLKALKAVEDAAAEVKKAFQAYKSSKQMYQAGFAIKDALSTLFSAASYIPNVLDFNRDIVIDTKDAK